MDNGLAGPRQTMPFHLATLGLGQIVRITRPRVIEVIQTDRQKLRPKLLEFHWRPRTRSELQE